MMISRLLLVVVQADRQVQLVNRANQIYFPKFIVNPQNDLINKKDRILFCLFLNVEDDAFTSALFRNVL